MSAVPATPQRRMSSESRREVILSAALDEFGRQGFHQTQMEHVASAAGVSKALIYQHFPSKEELFAAVSQQLVADFASRLPALLEAAGGEQLDAWRAAVHLVVDLVEEKPQSWALVVRHLFDADGGDPLRQMWEGLNQALAAVLVSFYQPEPGADALSLEQVQRAAEITVPMLLGGLQGLISWWIEHPEVTRAEVEERAVEFPWLGLERQGRGIRLP